jgi:uncharacterized membrane protein YccC
VGLLARELWAEAFSVQRAGVDVRAGLAGAAACSVPLALGIALGEEAIGVTASFGGLNAALGVPRGALRERIGWGGGAALGCCLSVVAATAVQDSIAASAVAAFVLVGLAAFLRTFGANGGMTGFVIGAIFVIMNGIPSAPLDVGERTLWFALGSLAGVVLMVAGYGRDASPPRKAASAFTTLLVLGARQFRDALARDRLLRAHALRLASIVALTTLVYQLLGLQHGYWVPLTVLAVLQPEEHASSVRAIQRATGTLIGTAVIAVLTIATGEEWLMVGGQCIAAFGLFALHSRGYFWLVVLLTPTALLTLSAVDYQGDAVALERAAWSALGIVLGVGVAELAWRLPHHRPRAAGSSPAPAVRSSPPP